MIQHSYSLAGLEKELDEEFHRTESILALCEELLDRESDKPQDYCLEACKHFVAVMRDQLQAACLSAEHHADRPVPLMVLCRVIHEAVLQLLYLLQPDDEAERLRRGHLFFLFMYRHTVDEIRRLPGGLDEYESKLTDQDLCQFERRKQLAAEADEQLTPEEKKRLNEGRWTGNWTTLNRKQLQKQLLPDSAVGHDAMYGVMSMATHVRPAMIHWSYKSPHMLAEQLAGYELRRRENVWDWLNRCNIYVYSGLERLIVRYDLQSSHDVRGIHDGLFNARKRIQASSPPKPTLRDDPDIRDLVDRIVQAVQPLRIVLFGSAARGEIGAHSDFDVLVILPNGSDVGQAEKVMYRSMWGFPFAVDLIAICEADVSRRATTCNDVISTALSEGEEIYDASKAG